jgi:hypothetical protein
MPRLFWITIITFGLLFKLLGFGSDLKSIERNWSFKELTEPKVPNVINTSWIQNEIDNFILSKLEKVGLEPPLNETERILQRRLSYALIGLPPPKEIQKIKLEKAVQNLLESPHYGEKWGRHWLDVVRYADSNGLDENLAFAHAWRFRDYVIDSFNNDLPFNQFVEEQLAGDLLSIGKSFSESNRLKIATGFLALGPKLLAEPDPVKMEMDMIDEQIDVIGQAFLGLTIGCARCHDHMSDPVSTVDYYKMAGIFKSTRTMEKVTRPTKWFEHNLSSVLELKHSEKHESLIVAQKNLIQAFKEKENAKILSLGKVKKLPKNPLVHYSEKSKKELVDLEKALSEFEDSRPQLNFCHGVEDGNITNLNVFIRGDADSLGEKQIRGFLELFPTKINELPNDMQSGRLQLARWITVNCQALFARVMVNRIWLWHFGQGLVSTPDNFGASGAKPTHPELLEWLACQFIENNWSVKSIHRLILNSSTWKSSSYVSKKMLERDPENLLYSRFPVRSMEVEAIRDTCLTLTGDLNLTVGGKVFFYENRKHVFNVTSLDQTNYNVNRRSVYLPVIRNHVYDFFQLFDFPDPKIVQGNRDPIPTTQQALYLMNSPFFQKVSRGLAKNAQVPEKRSSVHRLFMKIYQRKPQVDELSETIEYLENFPKPLDDLHPLASLAQAMLCSNEFLYVR